MKPPSASPLLNRLLIAALVGSLAWVWVLHRKLDAQTGQSALLASELKTERQRVLDTETRLAEARSRPLVSAPAAPAPEIRPEAAPPARRQRPGFPGGMFDNPNMQNMMATATKGALDQRYGLLFRKLKLDPASLERLKQLLTERQMSALDVVRAAQKEELGNEEINALLATSGADADAGILALLGESGHAQFQDYEQNLGSYGLLDSVERRLGFTSSPLSETQSAEVLRIIGETSESPMPAGMANDPMFRVMQGMGGGPGMMSVLSQPRITEQTIEAAKGVLDESQVQVLSQLRDEQQSQLSAMRAMGGPFQP